MCLYRFQDGARRTAAAAPATWQLTGCGGVKPRCFEAGEHSPLTVRKSTPQRQTLWVLAKPLAYALGVQLNTAPHQGQRTSK